MDNKCSVWKDVWHVANLGNSGLLCCALEQQTGWHLHITVPYGGSGTDLGHILAPVPFLWHCLYLSLKIFCVVSDCMPTSPPLLYTRNVRTDPNIMYFTLHWIEHPLFEISEFNLILTRQTFSRTCFERPIGVKAGFKNGYGPEEGLEFALKVLMV